MKISEELAPLLKNLHLQRLLTARARKMIEEKEYRYTSPAFGEDIDRLAEMIKARMAATGENQPCAEINVIRCDEGRAAWEEARKDGLESYGG